MSVTTVYPISAKQKSYIEGLLAERDTTGTRYAGWTPDWSRATSATASVVITFLRTLPKLESPTPAGAAELSAGIYEEDGHLFRVYLGQKSGQLLVKAVELDEGVEYRYLGTAARCLPTGARRLSLAEVGLLGKAWDHCLACGRRLDDPESVDAGIGPICAKKY